MCGLDANQLTARHRVFWGCLAQYADDHHVTDDQCPVGYHTNGPFNQCVKFSPSVVGEDHDHGSDEDKDHDDHGQILVAPEYDAAEASLVGIGVGVGVGAVLLVVVVGGVVLHRMRRKTPTAAQALPAAQAMQSVPLPQQVKKGRPVSVREEGTAAAAILVDTTGDGVADSVHVDTSGDGRPDTIVPLGDSR